MIVMAIASATWLGWQLTALVQPSPVVAPTHTESAICFIFSGLSLILLTQCRHRGARCLAAAVALLGTAMLAQYGITEYLGIEPLARPGTTPPWLTAEMTPWAAGCFILTGSALILAAADQPQSWLAAMAFACCLATCAALALLCHSFDVKLAYARGNAVPMPVESAASFLLLAFGLLALPLTQTTRLRPLRSLLLPGSGTEHLHMSAEPLRFLVDWVKDYALIMLSVDGTVLSWNTGAQRMYGYEANEICGRSISWFYPPGIERNLPPESELSIAAREGRYECESWRIRKDGSRFLANIVTSAIRDETGTLRGFAKVTRDITETKERDRALRYQAQILDLANDTIFVRDLDDRITYWNQGARRVYGWAPEEVIGQVTHHLLKTVFPVPLAQINDHIEREGHWEGELEHVRKNGEALTVVSRWTLQRSADGEHIGIIEMNYDISERKRMQQELQQKNAQLEQASRAKDAFLANMSHELRTPLNGIIGFSEIMIDGVGGSVNSKQREYLGDILQSGRHLLQLINDLLDLSKIGAGKMELYPESFSIEEAVTEACQTVLPMADKKQIDLRNTCSTAIGRVILDRQRFKQILFNLLSNAVKFTNEGGTVEVTLRPTGTGEFSVSVRDTGIGIAPENLPRLFKEFEQLDSSASRLHEGTGLGLALTDRLVKMHGGRITVASELRVGTTFTVDLPVVCRAQS